MNWSSKPPRISGWWFMGRKHDRHLFVDLVEVQERKRQWQWTFANRQVWLSVDDFPKYKWAGPIVCPSLKNFNRE